MGGEKVLLWSISLVLALSIVVMSVDYFVILHTKADFDVLAQQYFWICEQNIGLTATEQVEIESKLKERGFENIIIKTPLPGQVSRGDQIVFSIEATCNLSRRKELFFQEKEAVSFKYHRESISRRIVN